MDSFYRKLIHLICFRKKLLSIPLDIAESLFIVNCFFKQGTDICCRSFALFLIQGKIRSSIIAISATLRQYGHLGSILFILNTL